MHNLYFPPFFKSILCSDFILHILKSIAAECKSTSVEKHTTFSASFSSSSSWSSNEWTVKKACLSALSLIPGQPAGSLLVLISCKAAFEPLVLRDMRSRRVLCASVQVLMGFCLQGAQQHRGFKPNYYYIALRTYCIHVLRAIANQARLQTSRHICRGGSMDEKAIFLEQICQV